MKYLLPVILFLCLGISSCESLDLIRTPFISVGNISVDESTGIVTMEGTLDELGDESLLSVGHCWSYEGTPFAIAPDTTKASSISPNEVFVSRVQRLIGSTNFKVRAYAITSSRDTVYSEIKEFRTPFNNHLTMVNVEGGTLRLGSTDVGDEEPVKPITISTFKMAKYQVTQAFWKEVMGDNPSRNFLRNRECLACPVENISWEMARAFIIKLNEETGRSFRLPTEAEWEFAARGGVKTQNYFYSGSNDLEEVSWIKPNSGGETQPVGTLKANELGIHDMTGNTIEWCNDWYNVGYYALRPTTDPPGPSSGTIKVSRGCSIIEPDGTFCRVANRVPRYGPKDAEYYIGFRLAEDIN